MAVIPASLRLTFGFNFFCSKNLINGFACTYSLTFQSQSGKSKGNSRFRVEAKHNTRTESAKIRNRRSLKKFNGTSRKPRLSVFCSNKQLYAMLVDDKNKNILFYANTIQKSICEDPPCTTTEASRRVGEELIKACMEMKINEISSYDRNGLARGERIMAFEIPISQYGFLPK